MEDILPWPCHTMRCVYNCLLNGREKAIYQRETIPLSMTTLSDKYLQRAQLVTCGWYNTDVANQVLCTVTLINLNNVPVSTLWAQSKHWHWISTFRKNSPPYKNHHYNSTTCTVLTSELDLVLPITLCTQIYNTFTVIKNLFSFSFTWEACDYLLMFFHPFTYTLIVYVYYMSTVWLLWATTFKCQFESASESCDTDLSSTSTVRLHGLAETEQDLY